MASKRGGGGETSTGLIVTLIFFVLLAIGLGVATYYGFAQQKDLTSQALDAKNAKLAADAERDWYKYQAYVLRAYLGKLPADDKRDTALKVMRDGVAKLGTYKELVLDENGKEKPDKEKDVAADRADVMAVLDEIENKTKVSIRLEDKDKKVATQDVTIGWNPETKRPKYTFYDLLKGQGNLYDFQEQQTTEARTHEETAKKAQAQAEKDKTDAQTAYQAKLADQLKDYNDAVAKERKHADDLEAQIKTLENDKVALKEQADKDKKTITAGIAKKDEKINELEGKIADKDTKIDSLVKRSSDVPKGKELETNWQIVKMDPSGENPYINLGSADNVKPQLTFSIHGRGPDGKPIPESKGTLEVVKVINDHLSQAKIVSWKGKTGDPVKARFEDPVLERDFLYNATWNPHEAKHVAIAGKVDLHGDKRDALDEFRRYLKRQNVVVDAYLDPNDSTIRKDETTPGRITSQTDYLVIGEGLEDAKDVRAANLKIMQDQAKDNGVKIIGLREYLDMIGYRVP